jgi:hypothetical protein
MSHIETPSISEGKITSLSDFLSGISKGQEEQKPSALTGFAGQLWYRGVNRIFANQVPGVYRMISPNAPAVSIRTATTTLRIAYCG